MVVSRETAVLLLDVSSTMRPHLDVIFESVAVLVQRKLLAQKHDALGVVFFGSEDTNNVLNKQLGGYNNIDVARQIQVVNNDLTTIFAKPPSGTRTADFLDAVVVGMDMFMQQLETTTAKGLKRLLLITNGQSPLRDPHQGTLHDQVELIGDRLVEHGIKLDVLHVSSQDYDKTVKAEKNMPLENQHFLQALASRSQGEMEILSDHISLMASIKPRVTGTTLYRGDLEITPVLKIKVWVYKKVSQERVPTLKKFSDKAPVSDPYATRDVKMDVEYKSSLDPSILIPPDQRMKAYKYGTNNIPMDKAVVDTVKVADSVKLVTEKGIMLLGFVTASTIPRHYYMKDTKLFIPEPGNTKSALAISALVRAMENTEMVALVRCVWRQGQANVVIGVLTSALAFNDQSADAFYFNEVPFAEDIREYTFNSFTNRPAFQQPSSSQEAAADNLVEMLDLSSVEDSLQPEKTCNPILVRFYSFVHSRLLDAKAPVPPVYEPLRKVTEPDPRLLKKAQQALNQFCDKFTLTAKVQKGEHRFWREGISDAADNVNAAEDDAVAANGDIQSELSFDSLTHRKVDEVGRISPVQDFQALLARRDGDQFVLTGIIGMKKVIDDLLETAYKGNTYEKALSCIAALRSGCVTEEEPSEFNSYLRELSTKCRGKRLGDFWDRVVTEGITLISSDETPASDVSEAAAKGFLVGNGEPLVVKDEFEDDVDEMDALLDEAM